MCSSFPVFCPKCFCLVIQNVKELYIIEEFQPAAGKKYMKVFSAFNPVSKKTPKSNMFVKQTLMDGKISHFSRGGRTTDVSYYFNITFRYWRQYSQRVSFPEGIVAWGSVSETTLNTFITSHRYTAAQDIIIWINQMQCNDCMYMRYLIQVWKKTPAWNQPEVKKKMLVLLKLFPSVRCCFCNKKTW